MKVLMVEAEAILASSLQHVFGARTDMAFGCFVTNDIPAALARIEASNPDVVVLDGNFQYADWAGIKIAEALLQRRYRGKIILFTGDADVAVQQVAMSGVLNSSNCTIIQKGLSESLTDLLAAIQK